MVNILASQDRALSPHAPIWDSKAQAVNCPHACKQCVEVFNLPINKGRRGEPGFVTGFPRPAQACLMSCFF